MGKETFCIRPLGHESGPETEVFQLSNLDYLVPPFYIMLSLCYKINEQQDRGTIAQNLKEGLQITVNQYRNVAATIQTEPTTGKLSAVRKRDEGVNFTINVMDEADEFPDFKTLNEENFTFKKMDVNKLFPEEVSKRIGALFQDGTDSPAVVAQANFIRGGLIICVATNHRISDGKFFNSLKQLIVLTRLTGTGANHFVAQWAANSRALSIKTALPAFNTPRLDRSPLRYNGPQPSEERMTELKQEIGFVYQAKEGGDAPPPSTEPISLITLHFPRTKMASLKADASPAQLDGRGRRNSAVSCTKDPQEPSAAEAVHIGGSNISVNASVPWISTYDAIIATIWRAVTRARLPVLHSLPSGAPATSSQLHAVNLRRVAGLPENYYGNAIALPTETLLLSTLSSLSPSPASPDPNLAVVAATIRAGITRCNTREIATATAEWVDGVQDKAAITMPNLMGTGLYCTSWRQMTYYRSADFGFGYPNRVRRPPIVADGIVFVYPQRPAECGAGPDEGTDVVLSLPRDTAGRFLRDEELLRYAEVVEG